MINFAWPKIKKNYVREVQKFKQKWSGGPLFYKYITVADPGFLKGGFSFSLTKTPAQFELKTKKKKKVINLHTSLAAVFYIYYWMIFN